MDVFEYVAILKCILLACFSENNVVFNKSEESPQYVYPQEALAPWNLKGEINEIISKNFNFSFNFLQNLFFVILLQLHNAIINHKTFFKQIFLQTITFF